MVYDSQDDVPCDREKWMASWTRHRDNPAVVMYTNGVREPTPEPVPPR